MPLLPRVAAGHRHRRPDHPELPVEIAFTERLQTTAHDAQRRFIEKVVDPGVRTRPDMPAAWPRREKRNVPVLQIVTLCSDDCGKARASFDSHPEPVEQKISVERVTEQIR